MGMYGRAPVSVLQRERDEPEMNRFITNLRASSGVRTIDRGSPSSAREMINVIRKGGMLAFVLDQNIRTESVKVPFLRHPCADADRSDALRDPQRGIRNDRPRRAPRRWEAHPQLLRAVPLQARRRSGRAHLPHPPLPRSKSRSAASRSSGCGFTIAGESGRSGT